MTYMMAPCPDDKYRNKAFKKDHCSRILRYSDLLKILFKGYVTISVYKKNDCSSI